jgi:hypothetical protein
VAVLAIKPGHLLLMLVMAVGDGIQMLVAEAVLLIQVVVQVLV